MAEQARYCIYILDYTQVGDLIMELTKGFFCFASCNITQKVSPTSAKRIDWNSSNNINYGEHLKNATKLLIYLRETLLCKDSNDDADGDSNSEHNLGSNTDSDDSSINSEEDATDEDNALDDHYVTDDDDHLEDDDSYSEYKRTSDSD